MHLYGIEKLIKFSMHKHFLGELCIVMHIVSRLAYRDY